MGHSRKRTGKAGAVRYTAYYDDTRGRRRSAGTFASKKAADAAWRNAEALQDAGHPGDPRAGHLRFASFVAEQWLPNHVMEPTTRQSYRYNLDRHIIPWFGPMKMADILPIHVREWVVEMMANGVTPATIRHQKIILSAVFTTAPERLRHWPAPLSRPQNPHRSSQYLPHPRRRRDRTAAARPAV